MRAYRQSHQNSCAVGTCGVRRTYFNHGCNVPFNIRWKPARQNATMDAPIRVLLINIGCAMDRRQFNSLPLLALVGLTAAALQQAHALSLADLSSADASKGLKAALEKGALSAIGLLGVQDGFLGNPQVRIALPGYLNDAAQLLRTFGQGDKVDELLTTMNRAAETAVPQSRTLLLKAVQTMSVTDAKTILSGGNTAVTDFFASKTRTDLAAKFLPVVTQATAKVGLAEKYNAVAGKASEFGLVKKEDANVQQYVTGKTLDGLFFMISEEEKKIRANPVSYGSAILSKVFGSLQ
jgi:hypothetical protein